MTNKHNTVYTNEYTYALTHRNPQSTNEERVDTMQNCFLKGVDLLETSSFSHEKFYNDGYRISTQEPEKLNQLNKDFQDAIDCFNNNGVGVNERTSASVFITAVAQNRLETAEYVSNKYPQILEDRDLTNDAVKMVFKYTDFDSKNLPLQQVKDFFDETEQEYKGHSIHSNSTFTDQIKTDMQKVMCEKLNFIFENSGCKTENQSTALEMSCRNSLTGVYDFVSSQTTSNQQFSGLEETVGYKIKSGAPYDVPHVTHIFNDLVKNREVNPCEILKHVDDTTNTSHYCNWGSVVNTSLNQTNHPVNQGDAQKMLDLISISSVIPNSFNEFKDNVTKCVSLGADANALLMKENPKFITNYTMQNDDGFKDLNLIVSHFIENGMDHKKFSEIFKSKAFGSDDEEKRVNFVQKINMVQEIKYLNTSTIMGPQDAKKFKVTHDESRERGQRRM